MKTDKEFKWTAPLLLDSSPKMPYLTTIQRINYRLL